MDFGSIVVTTSLTVFLMIGMMIFIVSNRQVDGKTNRYFIIYIAVVCLLLIFDTWEYYLSGLPQVNIWRYVTTAMCYTLRAVAITVINILIHPNKKNHMMLWLPSMVLAIFAFTNIGTHWMFYFSETNYWMVGPLTYLPHIISGICLLILIVETILRQGTYKANTNILFAFIIMINIFATVIETLFYVRFLLTGTMMVSCVLYYSVINKQNETMRTIKQEQEIANGRIAIMLSQIQPHFLYNTLSTIRVLCRRDPLKAEQATIQFTEFLRSNMDSLSADKPIAFEQELAHTKNYLNLEQIRFSNKLHVEYNIGPTLFRLPTLTLQPIVENAVRYGVTKRVEGGTVTIATSETDYAYLVVISDDGIGYDPMQTKEDGRTHVGISNVSMRLESMCNGKLTIVSQMGVGTTATIEIPKGEKLC